MVSNMNEVDLLYEEAYKDYEERKARLIENLKTMKANLTGDVPDNYLYWLNEAIKFIKEREV